jgi:uncharacterized protein YutE (UPF0331/DUF86 family)
VASKRTAKLRESLDHLREALRAYEKRRKADPLPGLALTKAFEVAVEHGWRELKRRAEDEGLDVPSPKAAVRQAARLGLIGDPEKWMDLIDARNSSVHDYFGFEGDDIARLAKRCLELVRKIGPGER